MTEEIEKNERPLIATVPTGPRREVIRYASLLKTKVFTLIPLDTDDANDGTFVALNNTPAIQFADLATKVAYFKFVWPYDLIFSKAEFVWSTPATSGNGLFQVDIGIGGPSEVNNARTTGGTSFTSAALGTANQLKYENFTSKGKIDFRTLKPAPGAVLGLKIQRLGGDVSDTLTNTVNLYVVQLTFI